MENQSIELNVTPQQLNYMVELATLDLALSLMTRRKLATQILKDRLDIRINANRAFLNYLKAKQNEATASIPASSD